MMPKPRPGDSIGALERDVRDRAVDSDGVLEQHERIAGDGRGAKDKVILPYKDRLALFARYLQQLVMESLGKEKDLDGNIVHQGISVYGNKGSTDQHAYVQQLRDGVANFFAVENHNNYPLRFSVFSPSGGSFIEKVTSSPSNRPPRSGR